MARNVCVCVCFTRVDVALCVPSVLVLGTVFFEMGKDTRSRQGLKSRELDLLLLQNSVNIPIPSH